MSNNEFPDNNDPFREAGYYGEEEAMQDPAYSQREELIANRKARQAKGKRPLNKRNIVIAGACAATAIGLTYFLLNSSLMGGSSQTKVENQSAQTSIIDMEVNPIEEKPQNVELETSIPDAGSFADNERIKELEKQIEDMREDGEPSEQESELIAKMEERLEGLEKDLVNKTAELEAAQQAETERRQEIEQQLSNEERTRQQEIETSKLQSGSLVLDESAPPTSAGSSHLTDGNSGGGLAVAEGEEKPQVAVSPENDSRDDNEKFIDNAVDAEFETSTSKTFKDPGRVIVQGTVLSAVLETAISTELPGTLRAQIIEPVFSFDGSRMLMPAGTILNGTFNHEVKLAQNRVLIAWNRAITPNGESIRLGSIGSDRLGRSGSTGNVDNRLGTKMAAAGMITALNIVPKALVAAVSPSPLSGFGLNLNTPGGGSISFGQNRNQRSNFIISDGSLEQGLGRATEPGQEILEEYLKLPPVIRVAQGEELRIIVNRDLVFN